MEDLDKMEDLDIIETKLKKCESQIWTIFFARDEQNGYVEARLKLAIKKAVFLRKKYLPHFWRFFNIVYISMRECIQSTNGLLLLSGYKICITRAHYRLSFCIFQQFFHAFKKVYLDQKGNIKVRQMIYFQKRNGNDIRTS